MSKNRNLAAKHARAIAERRAAAAEQAAKHTNLDMLTADQRRVPSYLPVEERKVWRAPAAMTMRQVFRQHF